MTQWKEVNSETILTKLSTILSGLDEAPLSDNDKAFLGVILFDINLEREMFITNESKIALIISNAWMKLKSKQTIRGLLKDLDKVYGGDETIKGDSHKDNTGDITDKGNDNLKNTGTIKDTGSDNLKNDGTITDKGSDNLTDSGTDTTTNTNYLGNRSQADIELKYADTKQESDLKLNSQHNRDLGNTRTLADTHNRDLTNTRELADNHDRELNNTRTLDLDEDHQYNRQTTTNEAKIKYLDKVRDYLLHDTQNMISSFQQEVFGNILKGVGVNERFENWLTRY